MELRLNSRVNASISSCVSLPGLKSQKLVHFKSYVNENVKKCCKEVIEVIRYDSLMLLTFAAKEHTEFK